MAGRKGGSGRESLRTAVSCRRRGRVSGLIFDGAIGCAFRLLLAPAYFRCPARFPGGNAGAHRRIRESRFNPRPPGARARASHNRLLDHEIKGAGQPPLHCRPPRHCHATASCLATDARPSLRIRSDNARPFFPPPTSPPRLSRLAPAK